MFCFLGYEEWGGPLCGVSLCVGWTIAFPAHGASVVVLGMGGPCSCVVDADRDAYVCARARGVSSGEWGGGGGGGGCLLYILSNTRLCLCCGLR